MLPCCQKPLPCILKCLPKRTYSRQSVKQIWIHRNSNVIHRSYFLAFSFPTSKLPWTRFYSNTTTLQLQEKPTTPTQHRRRPLRSEKPVIQLTPKARTFFQRLFSQVQPEDTMTPSSDPILGFRLLYQQSQSGQPRMVFSFDFARGNQIGPMDEGCVSNIFVLYNIERKYI